MKSKFQAAIQQSLNPVDPPSTLPRRWTPPVPVGVGVDGPCDGYEHPRDKACLQGQLEGDFLEDDRDLVLAKKAGQKSYEHRIS